MPNSFKEKWKWPKRNKWGLFEDKYCKKKAASRVGSAMEIGVVAMDENE
jgi:hypothetical protein